MTLPQHPPDRRRWPAALLLSAVGALTLGADAVISVPSVIAVLHDPMSHEAQDAGMTAIFFLIPIATVGIACLLLAFLLWKTRAGGAAIVTAVSVVGMVILNIGGIPLLVPAIGVALAGTLLALGFVYRDWGRSVD